MATKKNTQKELEEFKKSLVAKSVKELQDIEQEIIKKAEETDKEIADTKFDLPEAGYKEAATAIREIVDRQSVTWQFTLGMLRLWEFWDPENKPESVLFPMLDQTLRTLGNNVQYTGHEQWKQAITVNEYFEPSKEKYIETSTKVFEVADKHQAVMAELDKAMAKQQLNEPIKKQLSVN